MKKRVSAAFLKKEVATYESLKKKTFTNSRYNKSRRIEDEAENLLNQLSDGSLDVRPDEVKAYVGYINAFSWGKRRDERLAKLQEYADFDVKAYADNPDKSLKEKFFEWLKPSSPKIKYLSASQMKKRLGKYCESSRKFERDPWRNGTAGTSSEKLRKEAQRYAGAVADGKIVVKPEDGLMFREYINIVCFPVMKDSIESKALSTVKEMSRETKVPLRSQESKPAWGERFRTFWNEAQRKLKVAAVSMLAVAGTLVAGKSCGGTPEAEHSASPVKTSVVERKSNKDKPATKTAENKKIRQEARTVPLQKIWNNYYDNTIEILSSASQKQKLYHQIEQQLAAGIYTLTEDVSKEKLAYSYLIYKEYGVNSSLASALNSKEKLSPAAQQKLIEDVRKAGGKGEGVKQMAAKRNNGRLSSYSKYDKASPVLQKQHIRNLKQLMQAKRQHQAG